MATKSVNQQADHLAQRAAAKPAAAPKLPKTLAACADEYYTVMQERLKLQRQVDELKKRETLLAEHLIQNLPKSDATGVAGKLARVTVVNKIRPEVEDWDALYGYIVKQSKKDPGVWALLQRRVGDAAVQEVWNAGKEVPGVKPFTYP